MTMMVEILKDWGDLLAVMKPAGWLTIPGRGNKEDVPVLSHALGVQLRKGAERSKAKSASPDLFVIHRLDEGTSGVVLFARTSAAHREFSQKFENGEIKKTYVCLVEGILASQIVDQPLLKLPSKKNKSVVSSDGKSSQTIFKNLKSVGEISLPQISLVEATPLTGRSHQIRVHLQFLKHPILGDKLYGGKTLWNGKDLKYPLLHAHRLEFMSAKGPELVEAPLPEIFDHFLLKNKLK